MHKMAAFKRLRPITLLKKEIMAQVFSSEFFQIFKNTFFTELLRVSTSILRGGRRLKQIEISIISKLHKENDKKNKNVLTFFIFYLLRTFFFFAGFTFYKEASYFIIFILSLCSNMPNLENIIEYIHQKLKKKKNSSRNEVFTRLFFIPG